METDDSNTSLASLAPVPLTRRELQDKVHRLTTENATLKAELTSIKGQLTNVLAEMKKVNLKYCTIDILRCM